MGKHACPVESHTLNLDQSLKCNTHIKHVRAKILTYTTMVQDFLRQAASGELRNILHLGASIMHTTGAKFNWDAAANVEIWPKSL